MLGRTLVVLIALAVLSAPASASAAPQPIRGRSLRAQAALDAKVGRDATLDGHRVQILTQLCRRPAKVRGCEPMSARMRDALEEAIGARITWVAKRQVPGPEFLVFAPVTFDGGRARAEVAWWERGDACGGGTWIEFTKRQGAWTPDDGLGWAWCTAVA